jgi:hypothetical protein
LKGLKNYTNVFPTSPRICLSIHRTIPLFSFSGIVGPQRFPNMAVIGHLGNRSTPTIPQYSFQHVSQESFSSYDSLLDVIWNCLCWKLCNISHLDPYIVSFPTLFMLPLHIIRTFSKSPQQKNTFSFNKILPE